MSAWCRMCGSETSRVLETRDRGIGTYRRRACRCGRRWTTIEFEIWERKHASDGVVTKEIDPTDSDTGPPKVEANPPTGSVGGVGGGLSTPLLTKTQVIDLSPVSDPDPDPGSVDPPERARAHSNGKTNGVAGFVEARDLFVAQWESAYGDKYPFEPKDGAALASMLRKHPTLAERWSGMVERYLSDAFWAQKRHPLIGLATHPVEFSGEPGTVLSAKTQQSRSAAAKWFAKGKP